MHRESFVTLVTNDAYAVGALVLAHSLRFVQTKKELSVLITEGVPHSFRSRLKDLYDNLIVVKPLQNEDPVNLSLLNRTNLGITYTKLHCWRLSEFSKVVFLDADTIALQNIDDLFDYDEFSAAPDTGWPDMFNSGVFVLRPDVSTYAGLVNLARTHGSFDGGDQGLLNQYFKDWSYNTLANHLPFTYNCSCWVLPNDCRAFYTRAPAWRKFGQGVKLAHFTGLIKPWTHRMVADDSSILQALDMIKKSSSAFLTAEQTGVLSYWWAVFFEKVKPNLEKGMYLASTYDPAILSSKTDLPPSVPAAWQPPPHPAEANEQTDFWRQTENYHPEFHDTTYSHLYAGQRVDQQNKFEEYHDFTVPDPFPKPPQHHQVYQHKVLETASFKKCDGTQNEYTPDRQTSSPYIDFKSIIQSHQSDIDSSQMVPDKHVQVETIKEAVESRVEEIVQSPSQNIPKQDQTYFSRNDKDPLFFTPKPTCNECLKELKWSKHFVEPISRHFLPTSATDIQNSSLQQKIRIRSIPIGLSDVPFLKPNQTKSPPLEAKKEISIPTDILKNAEDSTDRADVHKNQAKSALHRLQKSRIQQVGRNARSKLIDKKNLNNKSRSRIHPIDRKILSNKRNSKANRASTSVVQTQIKTRSQDLELSKKKSPQTGSLLTPKLSSNMLHSTFDEEQNDVEKSGNDDKMALRLTAEENMMAKIGEQEKGDVGESTEESVINQEKVCKKSKISASSLHEPEISEESGKNITNSKISELRKSQSLSHMTSSGEHSLCDRHRTLPDPPEWKMDAWERGEIDYTGSDRFCNILARIRTTLQKEDDKDLPIGTWL